MTFSREALETDIILLLTRIHHPITEGQVLSPEILKILEGPPSVGGGGQRAEVDSNPTKIGTETKSDGEESNAVLKFY